MPRKVYEKLDLSLIIWYVFLLFPGYILVIMFYYHNPLTFAGGATRLPSLEMPFSPAQPCKSRIQPLLLVNSMTHNSAFSHNSPHIRNGEKSSFTRLSFSEKEFFLELDTEL